MEPLKELDLKEIRNKLEPALKPYKVVRRDAIEYVGTTEGEKRPVSVYKVDGTELMMNEKVSRKLDQVIGLEPGQEGIVRTASGETGVRDFRNYLAVAGSITKPVSVALVANPATCMIDDIVPIKQDVIPLDAFFNFVNIFLEDNKLIPIRYEKDDKHGLEVTVYMKSVTADIRTIAPGEDFLVNSYFLRWTLGQIELGHYFLRLVCTNGQISIIPQSEARIYSLLTEDVIKMLELPRNYRLLDGSFEEFSTKALEAMNTRASMAELLKVSRMLEDNFVKEEVQQRIAPFEEMRRRYADNGYITSKDRLKEMKSGVDVWDLYNGVTEYATHNTDWKDNDVRRGYLQREAFRFLMAKRDIRTYQDIFTMEPAEHMR